MFWSVVKALWAYLLHNALEKRLYKTYWYLRVEVRQTIQQSSKKKKKSIDTELVLTIYCKQKTTKDAKEIRTREPNLGKLVVNRMVIHVKRGTKLNWHSANCENIEHSILWYNAQSFIINVPGLSLKGHLSRALTYLWKTHFPGLVWKLFQPSWNTCYPQMC